MPVFSVDTQAVADTAVRARSRIASIQAEIDAMNADIGTLQSSWTGGASTQMAAAAADWHSTQTQVQASLDMLTAALDQAALAYSDAESANASRFGVR